ncbi:hypothetical protein B1168_00230, partial [Enterococcus faecium]
MKVLVTGFDPFGGDKVNPAYEAVKKMPDEISGAEIIKVEVPTVFEKSSQVVKEAIQQHQPDFSIWLVLLDGFFDYLTAFFEYGRYFHFDDFSTADFIWHFFYFFIGWIHFVPTKW